MVYRTKENFIAKKINPFTNKPYDSSWILYQLTDSHDYEIMNGGEDVYTLKVSKKYPQWKMSVFDFLQFQEAYNKNIIPSISCLLYTSSILRQNAVAVGNDRQ